MPTHDWTRVDDGIFHDFHLSWISRIHDALNLTLLPQTHYSLAEQHSDDVLRDIGTRHLGDEESAENGNGSSARPMGALLLDEAPPRVAIVTQLDADVYARKRRTLVIRHVSDDAVVALIEIMSPGNKSSRHAFEQFLDKVLAALDQGVHLLIVDPHPPTPRDPRGIHAAIVEALGRQVQGLDDSKPLTLVSYLARSDRKGYAQPLAVGDQLADMPLFLSADRYVNVPLETTYMQAFQSVPAHLRQILGPA